MMISHELVRIFSVLEMGLLLFDLTRKNNGLYNRSNRTTLDMERQRSKLSSGICRQALSHTGARWRGGGATPIQVRSRLVKKDSVLVRVRSG